MNYKHGYSKRPIYRAWRAMIDRCYRPSVPAYRHYGKRGIVVCPRWREFENFLSDMGECPEGHSLDRIDNDGPYSPENCRWATKEQQDANKRSNRLLPYKGVPTPLFLIAKDSGVPYATLQARVRLGYSADEATSPSFDKSAKRKALAKRQAEARTHCKNGHELTADNTFIYSAARPVKCCKQCRRDNRLKRLGRFAEPVKGGCVMVCIGGDLG